MMNSGNRILKKIILILIYFVSIILLVSFLFLSIRDLIGKFAAWLPYMPGLEELVICLKNLTHFQV
jgi:hypothetical protein